MKVTGPGQVSNVQSTKKSAKTGGADFSKFMEGVEEAEEAKTVGGIKSIGGVNLIQEVNADGHKKRQTVDKGNEILDKLEEIRDSLLFGDISLSRLQNLEKIIRNVEASDDPKLSEIIEEIKTRAAVELAKLGF